MSWSARTCPVGPESSLCFCPSAGGVLAPTSDRSNMIINVKANFLDDCFINLVNLLDSCSVTREQPGDGCGSDTALNYLKEGKGWKEKGVMLNRE